MKALPEKPLVSIVIPTRNSSAVLEECLKSIKLQTYSNVEIIVADNYSVDGTREIAQRYCVKVVMVGPAPPSNNFFTAPIQRKIGATLASGDYIFFVDSDMVLTIDVIKNCVRKCLEGADAVIVPEISYGNGFWSMCKVLERRCEIGDETLEAPRFIKRLAYELVGGWPDDVGALDDWSLNARLDLHGLKITHSCNVIFHNEGCLSLKRLFLKKCNMGKSMNIVRYINIQGRGRRKVFMQFSPVRMLMLIKRILIYSRDPIEISGVTFMKSIEGLAILMGRLIAHIP